MYKYRRLLIILSFLFAIVTAYLGYQLFYQFSTEDTISYTNVPVAKTDIPPLTEITADSITYIQVEEESLSRLSIIVDENQLLGERVAIEIKRNSPFLQSQLYDADANNPFHLKDSHRAITIENSPLIGVGGHLKPGMFVDVLWTYGENDEASSHVLFQNIEILALGPPSQIAASLSDDVASTVTLNLELADAQKLALFEQTGSFKLALRSSQKAPLEEVEPINLKTYLLDDEE